FNGAEIHRDVAHVAGEANVTAAGRDHEGLGRVRAGEGQLVEAGLAVDGVAAVAGVPEERVAPLAAEDGIVARAAGHDQLHLAGGQVRGVDRVVAAQHVHRQGIYRVRTGDVRNWNGTHGGVDVRSDGPDLAEVASVGAVDGDRVGLTVAGARRAEVKVERVQAGRGLVVDGDGVGAAVGEEVDLLDAVQVHGDIADVAGEPGERAVGREVELLRGVRAVEKQRVGAALPFDHVTAVAGLPLEHVVPGAHEGGVAASAAV